MDIISGSQVDYFAELWPNMDAVASIATFLRPRRPETWAHVQAVAEQAIALAARFGLDSGAARLAGYGHDLAAVVPMGQMLQVAEAYGLVLSEADRQIPQVLHGRVAATAIAAKLDVADEDVLNAMRYHTTLRPNASGLELVVFVADKLAYDPTTPRVDYLPLLHRGVERSLEAAAFAYIDFCVQHQAELGWKLHPDLEAAHVWLGGLLMNGAV